MIEFLVHLLVTAGLLMVVAHLIDGIDVDTGKAAVLGALVLGLANAIVRPILFILTLPLTVLTLGLFVFIINAITLMIAAAIVPGFNVKGFRAAIKGSLVLWLLNFVVAMIFR